jgi:hypothetical protein
MGARSIYEKICPVCAAVVAREAERCPCGHDFAGTVVQAMQQAAVDEELYETYLTARLDQGLEALERARTALRDHPGDYVRATRVMEHVHELQGLRRELESQRAKIAVARPRMEDAASNAPTPAFRAAQTARAEAIARRTAALACSACGSPLEAGIARCACGQSAEPATGRTPDISRPDRN